MQASFGKIYEISQASKGYFKLTISTNLPFATKFLKFCLWDNSQLSHDGKLFKQGDQIIVNYYYQDIFLRLVSMIPQPFDECPVCSCFYEMSDAQRIDCSQCSNYAKDQVKERVHSSLTLVANWVKDCKYSKGQSMVFIDNDTKKTLNCIVYENHPIFSKLANIQLLNEYTVIGWKQSCNNLKINSKVDVIDIY